MRSYILFILLFLSSCGINPATSSSGQKPKVLCSLSPHAYFLERLAGSTLQVLTIVPKNDSPHTYDPTPKQLVQYKNTVVWYTAGEPFELRAAPALQEQTPELTILPTYQDIHPLLPVVCCHNHGDHNHHHHHKEGALAIGHFDSHIWLDPLLAKEQAEAMYHFLIKTWPENRSLYDKNWAELQNDFDALHQELEEKFAPLSERYILVSHPAFAYFCARYHFTQLSIEVGGSDPSPMQLQHLIEETQEHHIQSIFVQPQYSTKGADLIAHRLALKTHSIDPYARDYFKNMRYIADLLTKNGVETNAFSRP